MDIVYLIGISVLAVFVLRLLENYAINRAKYLVDLQFGSFPGNFVENKTLMEANTIAVANGGTRSMNRYNLSS